MVSNDSPEIRKTPRWRYVVPNAITCLGLLVGLTSMFRSMEGDYTEAAWLIILCVLLDKLDGTAARLLRATSDIGVQLDSFSDFVTFGVAPACLVFLAIWRGDPHGGPEAHAAFVMWQGSVAGWVLRALLSVYVLCAVIRLARFNVLAEGLGPADVFYGFATTYSGAFVATLYVLLVQQELWSYMTWLPVVLAVLGVLMVTDIPLPKVGIHENKAVNIFQGLNVVAAYICGFARIFPEYLFALLLIYAVGGLAWGIANRHELAPTRLDPYPES